MSAVSNFRDELQSAVDARHQANHPFIDKWADGQVSRDAITGASCEIWHWISNLLPEAFFNICAKSPQDVIDMEMENLEEAAARFHRNDCDPRGGKFAFQDAIGTLKRRVESIGFCWPSKTMLLSM